MRLSNYTIHAQGDNNKIIIFNDNTLLNLEDLLNTNLRVKVNVESYLSDLAEIQNSWGNLESIVEGKYGGFWDWETLQHYNVSGTWFTFAGYEDFTIYIAVDAEKIYIENELFPQNHIVNMPLDEFIDILEQWKNL